MVHELTGSLDGAGQLTGRRCGFGKLGQGEFLDLADAFAGDSVALSDGFQGLPDPVFQPKTPGHDVPVPGVQRLYQLSH